MVTFVLPAEKRLIVSFWTLFKYLSNHSELEIKNRNHQKICWIRSIFLK